MIYASGIEEKVRQRVKILALEGISPVIAAGGFGVL